MTISIQNGQLGLQQLQARQAFKPRPKPIESPPLEQAVIPEKSEVEASPAMDRQLRQMVGSVYQEVNQLAEGLGYVGLTESQVARALTTGDSLLADYHA